MTYIEIIEFITYYGVDIVVLGIITCAFTQILKTTLLKNAPNKLYVFLPVFIGIVLYALYTILSQLSFSYAYENLAYVFEKGFSVGAAATVLYVVCEQFARGSVSLPTTKKVIEAMIADYVETEKLNVVAQKIKEEFDGSDIKTSADKIAATLCEYTHGNIEDFAALSMLIAQTLERVNLAQFKLSV